LRYRNSEVDIDGTKLSIYFNDEFFRQGDRNPIFTLSVPLEGRQSRNPISSLSAGDAHFAFLITYTSPETSSSEIDQAYYSNIWSIRTDSRLFNDVAWLSLNDEFSRLDEIPPVQVDTANFDIRVLCALTDEFVDFEKCVSCGWMTGAICDQGKPWLFPFGRAQSTIPNLPVGEIKGPQNVRDFALGGAHIAILTGAKEGKELWTFGLNDHGQRGLPASSEKSTEPKGWARLVLESKGEIMQVKCGKANTFIVTQQQSLED
jgi:Regulator of chromosome condensation (RCC1) repeat